MNMVSLAIGGFFGAISRYSLGEWLHTEQDFPIGTLTVNLLGCFFLGWFFTISTTRWEKINSHFKLGIGTGFIGSFTTFSTFSVETLQLLSQAKFGLALVYVLSSVGGGIFLALAGIQIAAFHSKKPSFKEGLK